MWAGLVWLGTLDAACPTLPQGAIESLRSGVSHLVRSNIVIIHRDALSSLTNDAHERSCHVISH